MTQNIDCSGEGEALESVEPLVPSPIISHRLCRSKDAWGDWSHWDAGRGKEGEMIFRKAFLNQHSFISVVKALFSQTVTGMLHSPSQDFLTPLVGTKY